MTKNLIPTLEYAQNLARSYVMARTDADRALRERVAQAMFDNQWCVLHATAQIVGKKCWCADCDQR